MQTSAGFPQFLQASVSHESKYELYSVVVPAVQVSRLREVGITSHANRSKACSTAPVEGPIEVHESSFVRRAIARTIQQIQDFASIGKNAQRGIEIQELLKPSLKQIQLADFGGRSRLHAALKLQGFGLGRSLSLQF